MKKFLATLLALTMLIGMVGMIPASAEEVVTLKWVTVGSGMPSNYAAWAEKLNAYLAEKIGVNIEMEVISWGDWDNRRNVIVNTNEPYDLIFGNNGTYNNDVKLGAYLEITEDMLKENAPGLLDLIPAGYWDACRVNGKLYAVPTYKDSSMTNYFVWDKDLLDANGMDVTDLHTLESLHDTLVALKDKTSNAVYPLNSNGASYLLSRYDGFSSGLPVLGVRYDDAEMKVVASVEQEDVLADLATLHAWYTEGLINADAATYPESNKYNVCSVAQGWPYAAISTWGPNMGVNAIAVQYGDTIISNDTVQGSLNSISVNCEHPEKALALLNLINTDSYVRDSFYYGLEGDDWEYTADHRVHRNKTEWTMAGYTQATFFAVTELDDTDYNQWDEVKELNANAKASVLLGFSFDSTKVQDQISSCVEIYNRYKGEIMTGTVDPTDETRGVPAMMKEMRAAGFDEIVAEAQAQIDAWKAVK